MVIVRYREIDDLSFNPIFRVFISGSSESGKTYFAKQLLQRKLFRVSRVYYYHPDCHEETPTDWHDSLDVPVIFSSEFPNSEDFLAMPEFSCIVFDDLMVECAKSKCVDYLYRVLSGKRKIHVILMSQRYFHHDRYSISIRNCSNYQVLMRNADTSNVNQIGRSLGLKKEITYATECNRSKEYPYIFIDRTNKARARNTQVYTDILSKYFVLVRGSMKFYLLSEQDFKRNFSLKDSELAENVDSKQKEAAGSRSTSARSGTTSSSSDSTGARSNSARARSDTIRKDETIKSKPSNVWRRRAAFKKQIRRALHEYKINT